MSVTPEQHDRTSTPAVAVSVVLGTATLTLMALRLPAIDLPTQLSLASGLPLWALFALVTLSCIAGLTLTRRAASTGSAASDASRQKRDEADDGV